MRTSKLISETIYPYWNACNRIDNITLNLHKKEKPKTRIKYSKRGNNYSL